MPKGLSLSESEKGQIKAYNEQGKSSRWIARKLGRSHDVINCYLKNPETYGTRKSTGRKSKLSDREKRQILRKASNSLISCDKIKCELDLQVHRSTVWNVIKASPNIVRGKLKFAPALKPNDKSIRINWAP